MSQESSPGSFATSRPVAVLMVFVAAVVFGYFSYRRLPVRLMPELSYPTITVRTEYSGAAPEEVEKDVSQPIEEALGVISGLRRISSVSRADVSDVVLEFAWDTSMSDAVQDTLEKLDLVVLPEDAGNSLILRFDPTLDPVMELSLSSATSEGATEGELRRLRRLGELQVKRALEPIKGVAAVRVRGGLEEELHVMVDAAALRRAKLSIADVIGRLEEENVNVAGGTIKEGRADYMVRTVNEYQDLEQIGDTVLTIIDERQVRVRDVATVELSHRERQMVTRTNGGASVQVDVFKEADANIVELAARVRDALGPAPAPNAKDTEDKVNGLAQELFRSENALLEVVADRSLFIESSIDEVRSTAVIGGLLAVLVLFLFLEQVRSTLIIGISIPISLLVTFAPLHLLGVSLNIMSLGGLALGIGMLVDSSIVVLESIYRNHEDGKDLVTATVDGTRDVRGAVLASTLTTIGVFLPMVFVEGVAGQAFGDLGLAVVLSLTVSLIVALYFIPMLASRTSIGSSAAGPRTLAPRRPRLRAWRAMVDDFRSLWWPLRILLAPYLLLRMLLAGLLELLALAFMFALFAMVWVATRLWRVAFARVGRVVWWAPLTATRALLGGSTRFYPRVLAWSIERTGAVMLLAAGCLLLLYVAVSELQSELLPEVHQGEFTVEIALPVGTPLEETEAILAPVEQAILAEREHIETLIVQLGYDPTNAQGAGEGEHTARFKLLLEPSRDNERIEERVATQLRQRLARIPDLESRVVRPVLFSFKTPVEVEVYGDDLAALRSRASAVRTTLAALPQLTDVESSLRKGAPEVQIVYDRERMRRYGLNLGEVARRVRDEVRGREATRFNKGDRRIPLVVRLSEGERASVADVERLIVDPSGEAAIALDAVAEVVLGEGPSEVRRVDGQRVAIVRANLAAGASLGDAATAIENALAGEEWPAEMSYRVAGQNQEWDRSQQSLVLALGLSIFLVYVIMAAQFESLIYPLIIMASIPLAFVGSFMALWLLGINLSVVVFLGMIMLAGIVVNNAIVLVDYINILKSRGETLRNAVMQAGLVRLRPILMTTATTVLGLVPMALGLGDGAEIRRPLAITVISGLVCSTLLTLLVIPTLYVVIDRLGERLKAALAAGSPPEPP